MLIATEPKHFYPNALYLQKNSVVLNINANVTGFDNLNLTPDLRNLGGIDPSSQEFDDWYVYQIFNNDWLFINFMQIACHLRNGKDVVLLMYRQSDVFDAMNEALLKIIQIRYGYNYQIVDDKDGFDFFDQSTFTTDGIIQFDKDYEKYQTLLVKHDIIKYTEMIDESHI